jgi:molybdate transport system substrate-binding protein
MFRYSNFEQRYSTMKYTLSTLAIALALPLNVYAGEVQVAVAANFTVPMQKLAQQFESDTGHKAVLSFGSTGKFYAQITHGAPFEILLAADAATPEKLQKEGQGSTPFTYAVGTLVLWSKQAGLVDNNGDILKSGNITRLAIADPKLAPYGEAAIQTLTKLNLLDKLRPAFVQGENIGQTYQFVASGNAPVGFVAMSQVWDAGKLKEGSVWVVPSNMHTPIRQDAILLTRGKDNAAASALLDYLRTDKAREIIRSYGYEI